jgi:putative transposase
VADRDWPHAPTHRISAHGTFIVTAATYEKAHVFRGAERLDYLESELLSQAKGAGWQLEAWAVFSNHYHFVAHALPGATLLRELLRELHRSTGLHANQLDHDAGRQVWYQFWETELTFESSYLARLSYVHQNPVKHGLVPVANQYRWCSAAWFERTATTAQVKTIYRLKTDRIRVEDDFDPV